MIIFLLIVGRWDLQVLTQHSSNMYAANGSGIILAEKGQFDIAKDIFTQVS